MSDPEKRKRYDQLGPNWKAGTDSTPPPGWEGVRPGGRGGYGAGPGWESVRVDVGDLGDLFGGGRGAGRFSDFFETLFGGGRRTGAGFAMRGQDVEAEIPLTLEEAHRGGTRSIMIPRPKRLDVNIPAGVRDGSVIRLAGQGEAGGRPCAIYIPNRMA